MKLAGENVCSVLSLHVFGTFGTLAFWSFGKIAFRLSRCSMDWMMMMMILALSQQFFWLLLDTNF